MIEILISTLTVVKTESNQKGDAGFEAYIFHLFYLDKDIGTSAINRHPVLPTLDITNIHDSSVRA